MASLSTCQDLNDTTRAFNYYESCKPFNTYLSIQAIRALKELILVMKINQVINCKSMWKMLWLQIEQHNKKHMSGNKLWWDRGQN